jgi:hypothetical protein
MRGLPSLCSPLRGRVTWLRCPHRHRQRHRRRRGYAFTDFRIHDDGCAALLLLDRGLTQRQAGRMMQRLFEIEAYRMMALLACRSRGGSRRASSPSRRRWPSSPTASPREGIDEEACCTS